MLRREGRRGVRLAPGLVLSDLTGGWWSAWRLGGRVMVSARRGREAECACGLQLWKLCKGGERATDGCAGVAGCWRLGLDQVAGCCVVLVDVRASGQCGQRRCDITGRTWRTESITPSVSGNPTLED